MTMGSGLCKGDEQWLKCSDSRELKRKGQLDGAERQIEYLIRQHRPGIHHFRKLQCEI